VLYHLSNAAMQLQVDLEHVRLEMIVSASGFRLEELLAKYIVDVQTLPSTPLCEEGSFIAQLHSICV